MRTFSKFCWARSVAVTLVIGSVFVTQSVRAEETQGKETPAKETLVVPPPKASPSTPAIKPLADDLLKVKGPELKDKTAAYTFVYRKIPCQAGEGHEFCSVFVSLSADGLGSEYNYYVRTLFTWKIAQDKPLEKQIIKVKSIQFEGPRTIVVKNEKGDTFKVDKIKGYLLSPAAFINY